MLHKLAKAGTSRTNVCRNLHNLLEKSGAQYPVPLATVPTTIRLRKPRPHDEVLQWPVIRISDWARVLLEKNPAYLLGGCKLEDELGWSMILSSFWEKYRSINPSHVAYTSGLELSRLIPYAIHGDEGRGLRGKPFLVESFQPIISKHGLFVTNESGQPACTDGMRAPVHVILGACKRCSKVGSTIHRLEQCERYLET